MLCIFVFEMFQMLIRCLSKSYGVVKAEQIGPSADVLISSVGVSVI